jgi:hypothetical protein
MTIQNPDAFVASMWNWAVLRGCFGKTRIEPTDIDGLVERRGYFLTLETKLPNVPVKQGQDLMFRARVRTGKDTVVVVWGHPGKPQKARIYATNGVSRDFPCNMTVLRELVSRWYAAADKQLSFRVHSSSLESNHA